jgi:hypothetical protein
VLVTAVLTKRRLVMTGCLFVAAVLTLAACGGSSGVGNASSSPAAGGATPGGGGAGFASRPGTNGKIAAIAGSTMQVQNAQSGQVAVDWTATTKFSHQVAVPLTLVKAGNCIVASTTSGAANAASFTATQVTISPPVNGQCGVVNRGGGQRTGNFPSGAPRSFPSGAPRSFPSGVAGRFPSGGSFATGTVTSVSGDSIVIAARQFGSSASTTSRTVTVSSKTKISRQQSTTAKSLKVGLCVNALGKADSAGTVTATSVRITASVNGQCTIGFGGRNG